MSLMGELYLLCLGRTGKVRREERKVFPGRRRRRGANLGSHPPVASEENNWQSPTGSRVLRSAWKAGIHSKLKTRSRFIGRLDVRTTCRTLFGSPHTTAQCALRPRRAATCRPGAAFGQAAASCPAPARRQLARPRPASHSWAHQFPPHPTTVRAAPAASTDLPSPGAHGRERNRSTARCGHQNGDRGPWLCFLYPQ